MFFSLITLILIISRLYYNIRYRRFRTFQISSISIEDINSLIYVGNTYFILLLYSITWISMLLRTFLGDLFVLPNIIYLGDSTFCRIQVSLVFILTSALFNSLLLQVLYRYIRIINDSSRQDEASFLCRFEYHDTKFYILMIILSWIVSLLLLIPALMIFNVFCYFPEQYHCLILFSNVSGYIYSLVSCFIFPLIILFCIYIRVIIFVRQLPKVDMLTTIHREEKVIRNIVKLYLVSGIAGTLTVFFFIQYIITGKIFSLANRLHEFSLSVMTLIFNIGTARLNSLFSVSSPSYEITNSAY